MLGSIQILMDVETAEAIDTLRTDIHRVEKTLAGRIGGVESSLTGRIDSVESSLTGRIDSVESSLTAKIEHVETSLTAKMDEHTRHADIRRESMHDDIRLLAETLASLSVEVKSLRGRGPGE